VEVCALSDEIRSLEVGLGRDFFPRALVSSPVRTAGQTACPTNDWRAREKIADAMRDAFTGWLEVDSIAGAGSWAWQLNV
jgi:hypothetical protein